MSENQSIDEIERIKVQNVWQLKLDDLNSDYIWKHFIENDYYAVGFSDVNLNLDLSKYKSSKEIFEKLENNRNEKKIKEECLTVYSFINEIKLGDIIIVSPTKNVVCGIGIVTSEYIPPKKSEIAFYANLIHSRKIRWLYTNVVDVGKKVISNKNFRKVEAINWNKIILQYMGINTKINILNNWITSYRQDFDYDDDEATNFYKEVGDSFNQNLDEIIQDMDKGIIDVDRIYDDIILPRDTIFKDGIQNLKSILKAKPYEKSEEELKIIAIKYIDLMKAFRYERDNNELKTLLHEFDIKYSQGIGLSRVSASLLYLDLSKNSVINRRSKEGLTFVPRFVNYNFTLKDNISDYLEDNKNIRKFTEYLIENTLISSYADLDQFSFWLTVRKCVNKYIDIFYNKEDEKHDEEIQIITDKRNLIYFGAPGTGKSFKLNQDKERLYCDYERVTFHHDYSYANFIGTYKPTMLKDEYGNKTKDITYTFVPGPFIRTLVKAFKNPYMNHLLIIEEINRANVAAVFGDVFQLLDREKKYFKRMPIGASEYPIETSEDLKDYLKEELKDMYNDLRIYDYEKLWIPENMYIWATMNSADQGVFPMDSAFKRRWDFEYIGVNDNQPTIHKTYNIAGDEIHWNTLRKVINDELLKYNINEDKLLGPYFIPDNLDEEAFKEAFENKVLMYLFEDVARSKRSKLFSNINKGENLLYSTILKEFRENGLGVFNEYIQKEYEKEFNGKNKESD